MSVKPPLVRWRLDRIVPPPESEEDRNLPPPSEGDGLDLEGEGEALDEDLALLRAQWVGGVKVRRRRRRMRVKYSFMFNLYIWSCKGSIIYISKIDPRTTLPPQKQKNPE